MKQPNRVVRVGRASIVDWLARTRQRWSEMPRVSSDVAHQPGTQREKKKRIRKTSSRSFLLVILFPSLDIYPLGSFSYAIAMLPLIPSGEKGQALRALLCWTEPVVVASSLKGSSGTRGAQQPINYTRSNGKEKMEKEINAWTKTSPSRRTIRHAWTDPTFLLSLLELASELPPSTNERKKRDRGVFFFFFFFPFSHSHLAVMFRAAATKRYTIGADCLISISKREKMAVAYGAFDSDRSQHRIWFNMNVGWMGLRSPTATFHPSGRTPSPRCYAIRQWTNDVAPRQIRHSGRFRFGPIMDRFLTSGIKIREKERENTATEKNDPVQVVRDFASSATSIFLFPRSGRSRRWNKRRGRRKEGFRWFNFLQLIIIPNK